MTSTWPRPRGCSAVPRRTLRGTGSRRRRSGRRTPRATEPTAEEGGRRQGGDGGAAAGVSLGECLGGHGSVVNWVYHITSYEPSWPGGEGDDAASGRMIPSAHLCRHCQTGSMHQDHFIFRRKRHASVPPLPSAPLPSPLLPPCTVAPPHPLTTATGDVVSTLSTAYSRWVGREAAGGRGEEEGEEEEEGDAAGWEREICEAGGRRGGGGIRSERDEKGPSVANRCCQQEEVTHETNEGGVERRGGWEKGEKCCLVQRTSLPLASMRFALRTPSRGPRDSSRAGLMHGRSAQPATGASESHYGFTALVLHLTGVGIRAPISPAVLVHLHCCSLRRCWRQEGVPLPLLRAVARGEPEQSEERSGGEQQGGEEQSRRRSAECCGAEEGAEASREGVEAVLHGAGQELSGRSRRSGEQNETV